MTAEEVEANVTLSVARALENGTQPLRVLLSIEAYRALVARDGLAPRHIGAKAMSSLRALVCDLDLPVDCDRSVPDDDAHVVALIVTIGKA